MATILVVDDEPSMRLVLSEHLRRAGHQITTADNGETALQLMAGSSFDIVITDIIMPGKEGVETIRDVRRLYPATKIIAISGGGRYDPGDFYLEMAQKLGANVSLAKPFSQAELLDAVSRVLNSA